MHHNDEYIQTLQMNLTSGDPSSNHPWMAAKAPTPSKIQPQLQNLQLGWH